VVRVWFALALTACGRVGFDATDDASIQPKVCAHPYNHDEDGDGVDDACDGCPHIPDPDQIDSDGDTLDDVCDPHPLEPRDHLVLFDPFTGLGSEWTLLGPSVSVAGDKLTVDTRSGALSMLLPIVPANDLFMVAGHIGAGANGQRSVGLVITDQTAGQYYCEIDGGPSTTAFFAETYTFDFATYTSPVSANAQGPIENRDFTLVNVHEPPAWSCQTTWPADQQQITGTVPAGFVPGGFNLVAQGIVVEYDYFVQIHSD
jgi:hypothetical protein